MSNASSSTPPHPALEAVLRKLAAAGPVSQRMRRSAEVALGVVPPGEGILDAYRCGVLTAGAGDDGVAVLTPERLSVFERRGFRSPDQKLHLVVSRPFSIEGGPGATRLTLAAAGGRPTTIDLFEADRAEALRDELTVLRSAREAGWWTSPTIAWPGWLGPEPAWSYLGGDPRFLHPVLELRLQVDPLGFTLGDSDGSTAHLSPWSAVRSLHVIDPAQGFELAASRGFLVSGGFAAAWRSAEWSAFLVVGYVTGEQVFLGTTGLAESELRDRLHPVAAAMSAGTGGRRPGTVEVHQPAAEEPTVAGIDEPAVAGPDQPAVAEPDEPAVAGIDEPAVAGIDEPAVAEIDEPAAPFNWAELLDPPPARRTPPATPKTPSGYSLVEQLERLGALHRDGVLDDGEFARAKAAVLDG